MEATGTDAAQLALLRLLTLQKAIRKAVRARQDEAATVLARVAIEMLITGLYCVHEPSAVARLEGEQIRMMSVMLKFMADGGMLPREVLDECIRRLSAGDPARGPGVEEMAQLVDKATGASIATGLYDRYYRPTSNFALHAGAASLMRHVRADGKITRRPSRVWGRRAPARIVDACLGALTAVLAGQAGTPCLYAVRYADRHGERVLAPVVAVSLGGLARGIRPGQILATIGRLRRFGEYIQSGQDADDPPVRTARIRAEMEAMLTVPELDLPVAALEPFLDYIAAKIATESAAAPSDSAAQEQDARGPLP
jgi:hypothetical protein